MKQIRVADAGFTIMTASGKLKQTAGTSYPMSRQEVGGCVLITI